MKVLVCMKPVPAASPGRGGKEAREFRPNEFDFFAMEEAVRLKERFPGTEVVTVAVGPPAAEAALRKLMSLGADRGALIETRDSPPEDPLEAASLLSAFAKTEPFDLILTGVAGEDRGRQAVPPALAQLLGIPAATAVIAMELKQDGPAVYCERELEGGLREQVELSLPALLSLQSGINQPRYGSLSNVLRVKAMEIPHLPAAGPAPALRGERIAGRREPEEAARCLFIEGPLEKAAEELAREIKRRTGL